MPVHVKLIAVCGKYCTPCVLPLPCPSTFILGSSCRNFYPFRITVFRQVRPLDVSHIITATDVQMQR